MIKWKGDVENKVKTKILDIEYIKQLLENITDEDSNIYGFSVNGVDQNG